MSKNITYILFTAFVLAMTILELSLVKYHGVLQKFLLLNFGPHLFYCFFTLVTRVQLKFISRRNHRFIFYRNFLLMLSVVFRVVGFSILVINLIEIIKSSEYTRLHSCSMGVTIFISGYTLYKYMNGDKNVYNTK
jgi:hypothetical protein